MCDIVILFSTDASDVCEKGGKTKNILKDIMDGDAFKTHEYFLRTL